MSEKTLETINNKLDDIIKKQECQDKRLAELEKIATLGIGGFRALLLIGAAVVGVASIINAIMKLMGK